MFLNLVFIFSIGQVGMAHPEGHGPPRVIKCEKVDICSSDEIEKAGKEVLKFISETGQIDFSWGEAKRVQDLHKVSYSGSEGFAVTFENQAATNEKEKLIYILISPNGFLMSVEFDKSKFEIVSNYSKAVGLGLIILISGITFFFLSRKKKELTP